MKLTAIFHAVGGAGEGARASPSVTKKKRFQLKILKFTNELKNQKNLILNQ